MSGRDHGLEEMLKGCRRCKPSTPCWCHMPGIVYVSVGDIAAERRRREEKASEQEVLDTPVDGYP